MSFTGTISTGSTITVGALPTPAILTTFELKYWSNVRMVFPNLYKLAVRYLPIVGTSVPCERLFSKAGITLCEKRNRLSAKRLSSLLFLHSVDEKYWFGEDAN
jgi:hypothetical protein